MQSRITRLGLVLALSAPFTLADFRYDQSSRMTGGAMMGIMQLAARFSKNAMQPVNTTVAVKGNRMVMNHGKTATIYDLDKETVTELNFEKKEVSVTTFAEMKAFLEKASKSTQGTATSFEVDVKETGKSEVVNGAKAREFLMTMKVTMNNPQTGKPGEMRMEMSNWLGDALPGYEEIAEFHKRMAQKMDLSAMFGGAAAAQSGMGQSMAAVAKKMAEMKGVPVVQVMRMIPTDPEQLKQMEESQKQMAQAQAQQGQQPSAGEAAGQAAGQSAASAVAGRLGRLGGLGSSGLGGLGGMRRKKQEAPPAEAPAPAAAPAAGSGSAPASASTAPVQGSFSTDVSMIETTIETKNPSNSSVDASMFEVPGGFKTVKGAMQR